MKLSQHVVRGKQDLHETVTGIRAGEGGSTWLLEKVTCTSDVGFATQIFLPTLTHVFAGPGIHTGEQVSYAFIFTAFPSSPSTNTTLSLSTFRVPTKGEAIPLHTGTSVILSTGDNKKEASGAEVAVTDTELGAQSLLMTQCHGLYFSQELMERLSTSSFSSQMCPSWWSKSHLKSLLVPAEVERELLPVIQQFYLSSPWCRDWNPIVCPLSFPLPSPINAITTRFHTTLIWNTSPASQIKDQLSGLRAEGT